MSIDCDPNALMQAAKCFSCIPKGSQEEVMVYLLAQIAGGSTDPATLMQEAKCFKCIPKGELEEVMAYLLCQVSLNTGMLSGAGSPVDLGITPSFIGQLYEDTNYGIYWRSTGTTSANWTIVGPTWLITGTVVDENAGAQSRGLALGNGITHITYAGSIIRTGINWASAPNTLISFSAPNLVTWPVATGGFIISGIGTFKTLYLPKWMPTNGVSHTLQNLGLTAQSVNHVLARGVANPAFVSGNLTMNGGTSSPPTGQGIIDKATLIGRGVTVTTN